MGTQPENTPGTLPWTELITPDKEAGVKFYTELFGWTTQDVPMPDGNVYTMFTLGERPVAGCMQTPEGSQAPPIWLSYVNVEDVDASLEKAKSLGATVIKERIDLPMGSFAIIADPQGATFAFWQSTGDCS